MFSQLRVLIMKDPSQCLPFYCCADHDQGNFWENGPKGDSWEGRRAKRKRAVGVCSGICSKYIVHVLETPLCDPL